MSSFAISATGSLDALIDAREEAALTLRAGSDELKAAHTKPMTTRPNPLIKSRDAQLDC